MDTAKVAAQGYVQPPAWNMGRTHKYTELMSILKGRHKKRNAEHASQDSLGLVSVGDGSEVSACKSGD